MKCNGDYGTRSRVGMSGVDYNAGDFITPGTSGFGAAGILDNLVPDVKQFAKDAGKEMVKSIYQEYKTPILLTTGAIIFLIILNASANIKTLYK